MDNTKKLPNGDYEITIRSYLKFLNAVKDLINTELQKTDEGHVCFGKNVIGTIVKKALMRANK